MKLKMDLRLGWVRPTLWIQTIVDITGYIVRYNGNRELAERYRMRTHKKKTFVGRESPFVAGAEAEEAIVFAKGKNEAGG